eukprot:255303_1
MHMHIYNIIYSIQNNLYFIYRLGMVQSCAKVQRHYDNTRVMYYLEYPEGKKITRAHRCGYQPSYSSRCKGAYTEEHERSIYYGSKQIVGGSKKQRVRQWQKQRISIPISILCVVCSDISFDF